jgi:hypothetical protein
MPVLTVSLFTIAKIWNQPMCHEWIQKMWHLPGMAYYSATKAEWNPAIRSKMKGTGKTHAFITFPSVLILQKHVFIHIPLIFHITC